MTKKILLSATVASLLSTSLLASNGSNLIGSGVKSRAMGGIGIATFIGTDSANKNPAMLIRNESTVLEVADTMMISTASMTAGGTTDDYGTTSVTLPNAGLAIAADNGLAFGINLATIGGGAIAYDGSASFGDLAASSGTLELAPAIAYELADGLTIGVSAVIASSMTTITDYPVGGGVTMDMSTTGTGYGYNVGIYYELSQELNIGIIYKGAYDLDTTTTQELSTGTTSDTDDTAAVASEMGIGFNYNMGSSNFALDVKQIGFAATDDNDYQDDVTVVALGFSTEIGSDLIAMFGYNYTTEHSNQDGIDNGFLVTQPTQAGSHITAGFVYFLDSLAIEAAATYASEVTVEATSTAEFAASQMAFSLGASLAF